MSGDRQQPARGGEHHGRSHGGRSHVTWEDGYGRHGEAENLGIRRHYGGRGRGGRGRGRMHGGRGGRSGRGDYYTFANQHPPPPPQPGHWPYFPPPPQAPIPPNQPYLGPGTSLLTANPHTTLPTVNDTTTTDVGEFTLVDGKHSFSPPKKAKEPESASKTNTSSTNRFDPLSTTSENATTAESVVTASESPKRGPKKRKSKQTRKNNGEDHFTEAMEQARQGSNTADRGETIRRSDDNGKQRKGKGARKPTRDHQHLPNPIMIREPTEEQARAYGAIVGKSTVSWDDLEDVIRVDGRDAAMSLLIALALVGNGNSVPPGMTTHRCDPKKAYLYLLGENQVNLMKMFNNEEYGNLKRKVINEWDHTTTTGLRQDLVPVEYPKLFRTYQRDEWQTDHPKREILLEMMERTVDHWYCGDKEVIMDSVGQLTTSAIRNLLADRDGIFQHFNSGNRAQSIVYRPPYLVTNEALDIKLTQMEREGTIVPMNELGDILRKQLTSPAEAKRELLDLLTTYVVEKIPSMSKREAMQTLEHETDEFLMSLLKPESMMTHINVERERMRTLRRPRKLSRGKIWGSGKHQSYEEQSYVMRVVTRTQAGTATLKGEILRRLMEVFHVIGYQHGHTFSLLPYQSNSGKDPIGVYSATPELDVLEEHYLGGIGQPTQHGDNTQWKVFRFRCTSSIGLERLCAGELKRAGTHWANFDKVAAELNIWLFPESYAPDDQRAVLLISGTHKLDDPVQLKKELIERLNEVNHPSVLDERMFSVSYSSVPQHREDGEAWGWCINTSAQNETMMLSLASRLRVCEPAAAPITHQSIFIPATFHLTKGRYTSTEYDAAIHKQQLSVHNTVYLRLVGVPFQADLYTLKAISANTLVTVGVAELPCYFKEQTIKNPYSRLVRGRQESEWFVLGQLSDAAAMKENAGRVVEYLQQQVMEWPGKISVQYDRLSLERAPEYLPQPPQRYWTSGSTNTPNCKPLAATTSAATTGLTTTETPAISQERQQDPSGSKPQFNPKAVTPNVERVLASSEEFGNSFTPTEPPYHIQRAREHHLEQLIQEQNEKIDRLERTLGVILEGAEKKEALLYRVEKALSAPNSPVELVHAQMSSQVSAMTMSIDNVSKSAEGQRHAIDGVQRQLDGLTISLGEAISQVTAVASKVDDLSTASIATSTSVDKRLGIIEKSNTNWMENLNDIYHSVQSVGARMEQMEVNIKPVLDNAGSRANSAIVNMLCHTDFIQAHTPSEFDPENSETGQCLPPRPPPHTHSDLEVDAITPEHIRHLIEDSGESLLPPTQGTCLGCGMDSLPPMATCQVCENEFHTSCHVPSDLLHPSTPKIDMCYVCFLALEKAVVIAQMKQCEVCREWIEKVKDVIFASVSEKRRKFLQQHSAVLRIGANTTADRFDEGQKRVQRELELLMAKHGTVDDTEEDLSEYDGSAFAEPEAMEAMVPALNGADQTRIDGSDYTEDTAASSGVGTNNDQSSQDLTSSPIPLTEAHHESQCHATEEDDGTPAGLPPHGNSCNAVTQPRCSDSGTDGVPPDDDKFREESLTSHAPPSPPLGEAGDSLSGHGGPGENENGAAVDMTSNNTPGYNDGNDSGCNEAHHDDEDTYSEESLTNHESPSTLLGET